MASTKSNLSLQEIMGTLQKAGVSGGSAFDLGQNRPAVEQGVTSTLTAGAKPVLDQNRANYMAQIDKIAQMDQKLAGVYGDPTSPLYIERASKRDTAVNMGEATGYKAAGTIKDTYEAKKQQLQDSITQTLSAYDELTKLTKAQEVETARIEAANKKAKKVAAGGIGGTYFTTAEKKKLDRAGIDPNDESVAGRFIFKATPATQDEIINQVLNKKIQTVDNMTIDKVEYDLKKKKTEEAAKTATEKKAVAAKEKAKTTTLENPFK